jgi:hypothetical protein
MSFQLLGNRRSAVASSSTTTVVNPVKDDFPEALTYRYNDNSAWVPAAKTHDVSHKFPFFFIPPPSLVFGYQRA